jgi:hypothetical protein
VQLLKSLAPELQPLLASPPDKSEPAKVTVRADQ